MGYLCATCGGLGGLFETSHAHSDKASCISELRSRLDAGAKERSTILLRNDELKQQVEAVQKKADLLYFGIMGWFGYWRDHIPAEAAPSFHHAVDTIAGLRKPLTTEEKSEFMELAKKLDNEHVTENGKSSP
jgi:hypothetical protein